MKDVRRFCWTFVVLTLALPAQTRFVILGDRTGETQGTVYADIWKQIKKERPDFVLSVGDTIQGLNDDTAEPEWQAVETAVGPAWWKKLYLAPGNHDIWSDASQALFDKHATRPRHYSFDQGPVHVVVLDNSRSDQLAAGELEFLESDLAHTAQPVKFVVSHRPSWLFNVMLRNSNSPVQKIAKRYGVQYVVAGHVHQMMYAELDGVRYISMPSAGGHLRASGKYEDGWFFGHAVVVVEEREVKFEIRELGGRVSVPGDWGTAGLNAKVAFNQSMGSQLPDVIAELGQSVAVRPETKGGHDGLMNFGATPALSGSSSSRM